MTEEIKSEQEVQTDNENKQAIPAEVKDDANGGDVSEPENLDDIDNLAEFARAQLKQKQKANAQAKAEREAREKLEREFQQELEKVKMAEKEELERLQAIVAEREAEISAARNSLQQSLAAQAELRFQHAAEKADLKETEFVQYKLSKHLESLQSDPSAMQGFDIDNWMIEMKGNHPSLFGSPKPQERTPATSGALPTANQAQVPNGTIAESVGKNVAARDSAWDAYVKSKGLK